MKILMFISNFWPIIGGAENQAKLLASALCKEGNEVTVLTIGKNNSIPHEQISGFKVIRINLIKMPKFSEYMPGKGIVNFILIFYILWVKGIKYIKSSDIVHCHIGNLETFVIALISKIKNKPVICKAATGSAKSDIGIMRKSGFTNWLISFSGNSLFDKWIATNKIVRNELERAKISKEKISIIPNSIISQNKVIKNTKIKKFLYLGRIARTANRDIRTMLLAFDQISKTNTELELVLVGDGDLFHETKEIADSLNNDAIKMIGFDDPIKWFNWADCIIHPSRFEGFSGTLVEAMAHSVLCIANDIPPNRELLANGRYGILSKVGSKKDLFMNLKKVIKFDRYNSMSARAYDYVHENYVIEKNYRKYKDLYNNLISGKG